jgi:hypothetical protein
MNPQLGILFVGTGRYITLFEGFYESFKRHWCNDVERTFFVFSDTVSSITASDVVHLHIEQEAWPLPTLNRFEYFLKHEGAFKGCTHLMFANSNLRPMVDVHFKEIFDGTNSLFGTKHPGYAFTKRKWYQKCPGAFETNKASTAYPGHFPKIYFAGGLNGGSTAAWLSLCKYLNQNIQIDKKRNVNGTGWAVWHDESQINHYFNKKQFPKVLGAEYLYPEGWDLPVEKKVIILDKSKMGGHDYMRKISNDKN